MEERMLKPFVKWAGGKTQLLDRIRERMPAMYNNYYEPFLGGGAVLLSLQPEKAIINDTNEHLVNTYVQLRDNPKLLLDVIKELDAVICDKDRYYVVRDEYNEKIKKNELDAECAALMIWVNKHCFNGLYRVNGKGLFNVPYNNKVGGQSVSPENLMEISEYLNRADVTILQEDFEKACETVEKGDFVYFDSPYVPVSETASFTDYTKDGFLYEDHVRLAELYRKLDKKGAKLMLSNHNVPLVHELYDGFRIDSFEVRRFINSDASKRRGEEVIITNY